MNLQETLSPRWYNKFVIIVINFRERFMIIMSSNEIDETKTCSTSEEDLLGKGVPCEIVEQMNQEQKDKFIQAYNSFPIRHGAEACIYVGIHNLQPCIIKERISKSYRHRELEKKITRQRIKAEQKGITRCKNVGIRVPEIFKVDMNSNKIYMEYFPNTITVKFCIDSLVDIFEKDERVKILKLLCEWIGINIGQMHLNDIIHGDLTTSNMLIEHWHELKDAKQIIFIDFGLSGHSHSIEDKAVDLYVLERALLTSHSEYDFLFIDILKYYYSSTKQQEQISCLGKIIAKLEEVRCRGRKKITIG